MPRTHKRRSSELGKSEVNPCGYCGAEVRKGRKFCNAECYTEKRRSQPVEQRFWSKVDRSGECWLWTGSAWDSGYGQFTLRNEDGTRRRVGAHVFAYELTNGPVPEGLEAMHSCDVRLCVRPDHLSVGTHTQNVQDAAAKGHYECIRPRKQKLTAIQIQDIRSLVTAGELGVRVAERFGISKGYVSRIMSQDVRPYDAPLRQVS